MTGSALSPDQCPDCGSLMEFYIRRSSKRTEKGYEVVRRATARFCRKCMKHYELTPRAAP